MRLTHEQQQLVEDNIGIAYYMAKKYKHNDVLDFQELLSIAFESLTLAVCNHKPDKKAKFQTYAFRIVKYGILNEIYKRREQNLVQQILFYSFVDIADIVNSDLNPDMQNRLQLVFESLRNFKGTQREKAVIITFIRNPYLTQVELAEKAGVCQKTVSTAIRDFRQQLQKVV